MAALRTITLSKHEINAILNVMEELYDEAEIYCDCVINDSRNMVDADRHDEECAIHIEIRYLQLSSDLIELRDGIQVHLDDNGEQRRASEKARPILTADGERALMVLPSGSSRPMVDVRTNQQRKDQPMPTTRDHPPGKEIASIVSVLQSQVHRAPSISETYAANGFGYAFANPGEDARAHWYNDRNYDIEYDVVRVSIIEGYEILESRDGTMLLYPIGGATGMTLEDALAARIARIVAD